MPPLFRRRPAPPAPAPAERLADVLAEVRHARLSTSRLVTDVLSGGYRSTFRGAGVEFSDVREYVEGDDPRSVDWNVTARTGRPFVKRYVEERERTLLFVFDTSPGMAHGLGAWSLQQAAARLVALLCLAAIDNHDRVGLVAGAAGDVRLVLPKKGGGHALRCVRQCLELAPAPGLGLGRLLDTAAARVRRRAVVFVLSDFAGEGYGPALVRCARHHDLVAVRFVPHEHVDPPRALVHALDPSTSAERTIDFADARVRRAFRERVERRRLLHAELLGGAGIDGVDVEVPATSDLAAIVQPMLRLFRRRELREVRR